MKEENKDQIRIYEAGYLFPTALGDGGASQEASEIKSLIESKGGVFISEELPHIRPLAYSITSPHGKREHLSQAYFGWVKFEFPQGVIVSLEAEIKNRANVVRLLLIETVRENTLIALKTPILKKAEDGKPILSEEEIEKSIEKLVADTAA